LERFLVAHLILVSCYINTWKQTNTKTPFEWFYFFDFLIKMVVTSLTQGAPTENKDKIIMQISIRICQLVTQGFR
jgi:hypothetical protein